MTIYVKLKGYNYFFECELSAIKKSKRGNYYREILDKKAISKYRFYKAAPQLRKTISGFPNDGKFHGFCYPQLVPMPGAERLHELKRVYSSAGN